MSQLSRPIELNEMWAQPGYDSTVRPVSRHEGQDDTLNPDPAGMGTGENGYTGRDITQDPYYAEPGMFSRLHEGG